MVEGKVSEPVQEEPQGMQEEAQLLTEFTEIPGISSAWIRDGGQNGHHITVNSFLVIWQREMCLRQLLCQVRSTSGKLYMSQAQPPSLGLRILQGMKSSVLMSHNCRNSRRL